MSNVIELKPVSGPVAIAGQRKSLINGFARERRVIEDVYWLKENAELLNILECTATPVPESGLDAHFEFYEQLEKRIGYFPQYYRFFLSICLDLEDLGLDGNKGEALVHWAARQGVADAELSDLQRAEARRLMMRRGIDLIPEDAGLTDRLHAFIDRSDTFAIPNKKAAYELTHILFYLSEYGRRDPGVSPAAITSLINAGLLAFLDQNADLLAEICVALVYAGAQVPPIWLDWLRTHTQGFEVLCAPATGAQDDYHEYLVCNWQAALNGQPIFDQPIASGHPSFLAPTRSASPLRFMSQVLFDLEDRRSDDWQMMRPYVESELDADAHSVLQLAEDSTNSFEAFFAGFARTGLTGVAL